MLVLSRRVHEKILIPGLHTSIQVLSAKRGAVRLGIEAPPDVTILREEVQDQAAAAGELPPGPPSAALAGSLCRQLKAASIGLGVARLQLQAGFTEEVQASLETLHQEIQRLRQQLEPRGQEAPPRPVPTGRERPARHNPHKRTALTGCPG